MSFILTNSINNRFNRLFRWNLFKCYRLFLRNININILGIYQKSLIILLYFQNLNFFFLPFNFLGYIKNFIKNYIFSKSIKGLKKIYHNKFRESIFYDFKFLVLTKNSDNKINEVTFFLYWWCFFRSRFFFPSLCGAVFSLVNNFNYFFGESRGLSFFFKDLIKFEINRHYFFSIFLKDFYFFLLSSVYYQLRYLITKEDFSYRRLNFFFSSGCYISAAYIVFYIQRLIKKDFKYFLILEKLKNIFSFLKSFILGYRICLCGRFTRDARATYVLVSHNRVSLGKITESIDFASGFCLTKNGIVGYKVWINFSFSNFYKIY